MGLIDIALLWVVDSHSLLVLGQEAPFVEGFSVLGRPVTSHRGFPALLWGALISVPGTL